MTKIKLIDPSLFTLTDDELSEHIRSRSAEHHLQQACVNERERRREVAVLTNYIAKEPDRIAELEKQIDQERKDTERDRRRLAKLTPTDTGKEQ